MAKRGLGRGLSALISDSDDIAPRSSNAPQGAPAAASPAAEGAQKLPLNLINRGQFQPRVFFNEEELAELATSIKKNGVVQPIIVRNIAKGYEIVAGERRWRAARIAGLHEIPAVVMNISDKQALEIALVENIQRRDLNPVEVANGYQRLIDEFNYTQEELSEVVGKSRSQVTNTLRLLSLPEPVKNYLADDKITIGHARALIGVKQAKDIAEQVVKENLNVRQTEKLVKETAEFPREQVENSKKRGGKDPDILELERAVSQNIKIPVAIANRGQKGKVIITYRSMDELDKVLRILEQGAAAETAEA